MGQRKWIVGSESSCWSFRKQNKTMGESLLVLSNIKVSFDFLKMVIIYASLALVACILYSV